MAIRRLILAAGVKANPWTTIHTTEKANSEQLTINNRADLVKTISQKLRPES
jgi:hypothetical protein